MCGAVQHQLGNVKFVPSVIITHCDLTRFIHAHNWGHSQACHATAVILQPNFLQKNLACDSSDAHHNQPQVHLLQRSGHGCLTGWLVEHAHCHAICLTISSIPAGSGKIISKLVYTAVKVQAEEREQGNMD